jgi:hypothetical protein
VRFASWRDHHRKKIGATGKAVQTVREVDQMAFEVKQRGRTARSRAVLRAFPLV